MFWIFVWQLAFGGNQLSRDYPTQQLCEEARMVVEISKKSPDHFLPITLTYPCIGVKR